jgi:hypothetical protein
MLNSEERFQKTLHYTFTTFLGKQTKFVTKLARKIIWTLDCFKIPLSDSARGLFPWWRENSNYVSPVGTICVSFYSFFLKNTQRMHLVFVNEHRELVQ